MNSIKNTLSVTHFSPLPPPVGGVSVFVSRLHNQLLANGIDSRVAVPRIWQGELSPGISHRKGFPWRFAHFDALLHLAMPLGTDIVHCHECYLSSAPTLLALRARGRKLVITVHSPLHCIPPIRFLPWQKWCARKIISDPTIQWVAVSVDIAGLLHDSGVCGAITVLPAYLPNTAIDTSLPKPIEVFISSHNPLIFAYAHKFIVNDGRDLYGFDEALLQFQRLLPKWPHAGLLLLCSEPNLDEGTRRVPEILDTMITAGIKGKCFMHLAPISSLLPILSRTTLYLRPTLIDGDSVLIREALAVNCKVVASNVVRRPEGVYTYDLHNRIDMDLVVSRVLEIEAPSIRKNNDQNVFEEMKKIYLSASA